MANALLLPACCGDAGRERAFRASQPCYPLITVSVLDQRVDTLARLPRGPDRTPSPRFATAPSPPCLGMPAAALSQPAGGRVAAQWPVQPAAGPSCLAAARVLPGGWTGLSRPCWCHDQVPPGLSRPAQPRADSCAAALPARRLQSSWPPTFTYPCSPCPLLQRPGAPAPACAPRRLRRAARRGGAMMTAPTSACCATQTAPSGASATRCRPTKTPAPRI